MTHSEESPSGKTNFEDVGYFHNRFGLPHVLDDDEAGPRPIDPELLQFRMEFLLEELTEFIEGAGYKLTGDEYGNMDIRPLRSHPAPDHAQMFDAMLDLTYVAMGTAHLAGYPWQAGWDEVQRANMSKVRAAPDGSDSVRRSSFDVVKPPDFVPPDIEALLKDYGWPPND